MTSLTWGRRYLMCPPDHFAVSYSINPWMDTSVPVDRARAREQWDGLRAAIIAAGGQVEVLQAQAGLPDLVFIANLGVVDGDVFVPARMRNSERAGEPAVAERWFAKRGWRIARLSEDVHQEGAGDALPFAGKLLAGYRTRSSASAYVEMARLIDAPIIPVELDDPRMYHLDLTFSPLDDRSAIVAPHGWDDEGRALIEGLVPDPLVLTPDEADVFCANSIVVGRTVIMPACPPRVRAWLQERDFAPVVVDVSEFLKAGGGPRCLTLALDVSLSAGAAPAPVGHREDAAELADRYSAHNYAPLPVVVARGEGAWVEDADGRRLLDGLAGYSALNFGHRHPALVSAARRQLERATLTSRAFHNDQLGPFSRELSAFCRKDLVLPMNTGAEAVETAIKVSRKWGYDVKGVAPGQAKIVVCDGNFHGRTTTIVSFSGDPEARDGFGPYTPGFVSVPHGDAVALEQALRDPDVVAFLAEPIQGEAGVIIPPDGWLTAARRLCTAYGVLLVADEIQSGLGRTGTDFACDHEGVTPDMYVLGKALGGGVLPVSAVVADEAVLGVLHPGEHGSTFGGNPLACAVGRAVLRLLATGELQDNAVRMGDRLRAAIDAAAPSALAAVRHRGLWFGLDVRADLPPARAVCLALLERGVLAKDAHGHTIRLSPPLIVTEAETDLLAERLVDALGAVAASASSLAA
ncbi:MAG TPA: ornithine--oxo-acid transaminase [Solirubrobacteraceae bacterium]